MEENKLLDEQEVNIGSSKSEDENVVVEEKEISKTKRILRWVKTKQNFVKNALKKN